MRTHGGFKQQFQMTRILGDSSLLRKANRGGSRFLSVLVELIEKRETELETARQTSIGVSVSCSLHQAGGNRASSRGFHPIVEGGSDRRAPRSFFAVLRIITGRRHIMKRSRVDRSQLRSTAKASKALLLLYGVSTASLVMAQEGKK